jgi:hypothetical protein
VKENWRKQARVEDSRVTDKYKGNKTLNKKREMGPRITHGRNKYPENIH